MSPQTDDVDALVRTIIAAAIDLQDLHHQEQDGSAWPTSGDPTPTTTSDVADPTGATAGNRNTATAHRIHRQLTQTAQQLESLVDTLRPQQPIDCICCHQAPATPAKPRCQRCHDYLTMHGQPCSNQVHDDRPVTRDCECADPLCDAKPHVDGHRGRCTNDAADDRTVCEACHSSVQRAGQAGAA